MCYHKRWIIQDNWSMRYKIQCFILFWRQFHLHLPVLPMNNSWLPSCSGHTVQPGSTAIMAVSFPAIISGTAKSMIMLISLGTGMCEMCRRVQKQREWLKAVCLSERQADGVWGKWLAECHWMMASLGARMYSWTQPFSWHSMWWYH